MDAAGTVAVAGTISAAHSNIDGGIVSPRHAVAVVIGGEGTMRVFTNDSSILGKRTFNVGVSDNATADVTIVTSTCNAANVPCPSLDACIGKDDIFHGAA